MFSDLIARLVCDGLDELIEIVALEECGSSALTAKQKMLVTFASGDERLTAFGLMNALNQAEFFQLFQRAIDGDQPEGGILIARRIIHLDRGQGALAGSDDLNDCLSRACQPISVILQLSEPAFDRHK